MWVAVCFRNVITTRVIHVVWNVVTDGTSHWVDDWALPVVVHHVVSTVHWDTAHVTHPWIRPNALGHHL